MDWEMAFPQVAGAANAQICECNTIDEQQNSEANNLDWNGYTKGENSEEGEWMTEESGEGTSASAANLPRCVHRLAGKRVWDTSGSPCGRSDRQLRRPLEAAF